LKEAQPVDLFKKFRDNFFELFMWIKDTISHSNIFNFIRIVNVTLPEEDTDNKDRTRCCFAFYTFMHKYVFTVVKPCKDELEGFISGEVSLRKPLAGEKHSGSNSLTGGGVYSEQTWINFLKGLARYEIVELSPFAYRSY